MPSQYPLFFSFAKVFRKVRLIKFTFKIRTQDLKPLFIVLKL